MYINEKTAEVLNDLIRINNDRIKGYEKAADETKAKDTDLQAVFRQMAAESRSYVNDLRQYVDTSGTNLQRALQLLVKYTGRGWM